MQYLGGKSVIAERLYAAIRPYRHGRLVWDAFCGGLSVSVACAKGGPVVSSDANPALCALYEALRGGWDPPAELTEADYRAARELPDSDPRKAFAGFGCSFGGKWFGGYARAKKGPSYAAMTRNSLLADLAVLEAAGWSVARLDALACAPGEMFDDPGSVVCYFDPPYAGTEGYGAMGAFDTARFWSRVREWAAWTDVFVSEYGSPLEAVPVLEFDHGLRVAGGTQRAARTERLYHFGPDTPCRVFRGF